MPTRDLVMVGGLARHQPHVGDREQGSEAWWSDQGSVITDQGSEEKSADRAQTRMQERGVRAAAVAGWVFWAEDAEQSGGTSGEYRARGGGVLSDGVCRREDVTHEWGVRVEAATLSPSW